jgi:hypothetical protein
MLVSFALPRARRAKRPRSPATGPHVRGLNNYTATIHDHVRFSDPRVTARSVIYFPSNNVLSGESKIKAACPLFSPYT